MDPLGRPYDDEDEGRICARSRGCGRPRDDGGAERGRDVAVDLPAPPPPPPPPEAKPEIVLTDEDWKSTRPRRGSRRMQRLRFSAWVSLAKPAFSSMLSTFALSGVIGYQVLARCATGTLLSAPARLSWVPECQVVWESRMRCTSPLMAVTNAISGMTAIGGIYVMGGGVFPSTSAQVTWQRSFRVDSCVRSRSACARQPTPTVGRSPATAPWCRCDGDLRSEHHGRILVTKKMLDMFKRPTDPPEYYEYYGAPTAAFVTGYAATSLAGFPESSLSRDDCGRARMHRWYRRTSVAVDCTVRHFFAPAFASSALTTQSSPTHRSLPIQARNHLRHGWRRLRHVGNDWLGADPQ